MSDPLTRLGLRRRRPPSAGAAPAEPAPPRRVPADRNDYSWLFPPDTVADPGPWDQYWRDQLTHGTSYFVHMFVDDGDLVDAMRAHGLRTVLCVGNGISQEPKALARAGFDVTALDLSPLATDVAERAPVPDDVLDQLLGGRAPALGGRVAFVAGDLRDPTVCPGPYDVVVERKTLQLVPEAERDGAMRAVARRLATPGVFFSQCHDGGWRPPAPPRNATERWFEAEGWQFWSGETRPAGQVAWPFTTTG